MKNILIILTLFLFSCNESVTISKEEYNAKMKEVIEETLKNGAEEAGTEYDSDNNVIADKDSIFNTFEQSYKKFKI